MTTRSVRYALVGGLLGLGAPAGLFLFRTIRRLTSAGSGAHEGGCTLEPYIYTATSTPLVFGIFGAVVGRYADRLALLATTDSLTGLANARAFHDRLTQELGRAARYQEPLSLLLLDLDGLKQVNDRYGHETGDAALRWVALAIRKGVREIDFGARLGGDEFAVLAPCTDEASADVLAERLRALVEKGVEECGGPGTTISIGIASLFPCPGQRIEATSLVTAADAALYVAKTGGGNRAVKGGQCVHPQEPRARESA